MEQQHPIPQQISAYQFRLVGDMTLKQFFQVAGGALVALLVYSSSLSPYIKWPLIVFSFLFGVALAFFPLEDRPLSKWILLFLRAIYSPTIYEWKRFTKKLVFFQPEPEEAAQAAQAAAITETTGLSTPELNKLEKGEQEFLTKVTQHFSSDSSTPPVTPLVVKEEVTLSPVTPGVVRGEVKVPRSTPLEVEQEQKVVELPKPPELATPSLSTGFEVSPIAGQKTQGAQAARFSLAAAPPTPPTQPNIIVGQVVDPEGNILENAILEIRDADGRPVRALKSNKLGHFMIVTPLINGKYEIITEKEGFIFNPISLEANGEPIQPIAIWAKERSEGASNSS